MQGPTIATKNFLKMTPLHGQNFLKSVPVAFIAAIRFCPFPRTSGVRPPSRNSSAGHLLLQARRTH